MHTNRPFLEKKNVQPKNSKKKFFFLHRSIYIPKSAESNFKNLFNEFGLPDLSKKNIWEKPYFKKKKGNFFRKARKINIHSKESFLKFDSAHFGT